MIFLDPSQTIKLVVLIILLFLSGFFSSAETALTTVSQIRLLSLSQAGNKRAALTLRVKDNTSKMLSAVLIGNNIVNISASSLATTLAIDISGGNSLVGLFTGILFFITFNNAFFMAYRNNGTKLVFRVGVLGFAFVGTHQCQHGI